MPESQQHGAHFPESQILESGKCDSGKCDPGKCDAVNCDSGKRASGNYDSGKCDPGFCDSWKNVPANMIRAIMIRANVGEP
jgi:hypothetical protein